MRTDTRLAIFLLVIYASACPAEERLPPSQPRPATTALEALERYVEHHYPTVADPSRRRAWSFFIGGTVAATGSVGLALIPTMNGWSPGGEEDDTLTFVGLLGGFHGMLVSPFVGIGLGELLYPGVDLRGEYGSLLDLPAEEREERARLVLRRIVKRDTQRQVAQVLFTVGATAGSVGAYYAGESLIGRNPAAVDVGKVYAIGLFGGLLIFAAMLPPLIYGSGTAELRSWVRE